MLRSIAPLAQTSQPASKLFMVLVNVCFVLKQGKKTNFAH